MKKELKMAFEGVPNETRKSFEDGTTIFERVLPGADRMYPDTDSPPIPLQEEDIKKLGEKPSGGYQRKIPKMKPGKSRKILTLISLRKTFSH